MSLGSRLGNDKDSVSSRLSDKNLADFEEDEDEDDNSVEDDDEEMLHLAQTQDFGILQQQQQIANMVRSLTGMRSPRLL